MAEANSAELKVVVPKPSVSPIALPFESCSTMVCDKLLLSVKTSPVTFAVWVSLTSLIELKLNSKSTAASSCVKEPLLTEKERPETGSALLTTFI